MLRVNNFRAFAQGVGLAVIGLIVGAASLYAWGKYQHHFWTAQRGPTAISLAELEKIEHPSQLPSPWIAVKFEKAYDTEKKVTLEHNGRRQVTYKYLLVKVNESWLLALVPTWFSGDTISGHPKLLAEREGDATLAAIREEKKLKKVHNDKILPLEFRPEPDYGKTWTYFGMVMGMFAATAGLFSYRGGLGIYQGLFGPAPVTVDEFEKRATVQVDAKIASIFESAGSKAAAAAVAAATPSKAPAGLPGQ
jgi:hypothetical protein